MNVKEAKTIVKVEVEIQRRKLQQIKNRRTAARNHKRLYKMYKESKTTY